MTYEKEFKKQKSIILVKNVNKKPNDISLSEL